MAKKINVAGLPRKLMVCLREKPSQGKSMIIRALAVEILSKNPKSDVNCYQPEELKDNYKGVSF